MHRAQKKSCHFLDTFFAIVIIIMTSLFWNHPVVQFRVNCETNFCVTFDHCGFNEATRSQFCRRQHIATYLSSKDNCVKSFKVYYVNRSSEDSRGPSREPSKNWCRFSFICIIIRLKKPSSWTRSRQGGEQNILIESPSLFLSSYVEHAWKGEKSSSWKGIAGKGIPSSRLASARWKKETEKFQVQEAITRKSIFAWERHSFV